MSADPSGEPGARDTRGPEPPDGPAARVPEADELTAIDPDAWARVLVHARRALHDLDDDALTARLRQLRASPTSRLAAGGMRGELAAAIARGGPLWRSLHARLADADLPDRLAWLVAGRPPGPPAAPAPAPEPDDTDAALEAERDRLRARASELRRERDEARRKADGSEARADTLEGKLDRTRERLAEERRQTARLRQELEEAREARREAVEREQRRHESRIAELEEELSEYRRREQERARRRRRQHEREAAHEGADQRAARDGPAVAGRPLATPGRPSRLPEGMRADTAEGARALMTPGRRVLVDGYNVTLTHQPGRDLTTQRAWLVRLADQAAARFDVRPELIFDGDIGVGDHPGVRRRVSIRFSSPPVTADDEIAFLVEAAEPDEPILVVTDDRELRDRVVERSVDVVGTGPFRWALG